MAPPPITLFHHHLLIIPLPVHEEQQKARDRKEDAIHDSKRKARLQHRAILVRIQMERRIAVDAIIIDREGEVVVVGKMGAIGLRNVAEFVDASDEGADEAEIDEGDEEGGVAGGFAAKDRGDGPGGGEDGDDEEDEDIIWCEEVLLLELMDKKCLLERQNTVSDRLHRSRHTSMPRVGIRVMISRKRQKVNSKPPIILTVMGLSSAD